MLVDRFAYALAVTELLEVFTHFRRRVLRTGGVAVVIADDFGDFDGFVKIGVDEGFNVFQRDLKIAGIIFAPINS